MGARGPQLSPCATTKDSICCNYDSAWPHKLKKIKYDFIGIAAETWPLFTGTEQKHTEGVWGEVAKSSFYSFARHRGHSGLLLLLLLSHFSRVRLCATPQAAAHQAPLSMGFTRQEHWSGLPFPSPMHEREK